MNSIIDTYFLLSTVLIQTQRHRPPVGQRHPASGAFALYPPHKPLDSRSKIRKNKTFYILIRSATTSKLTHS